MAISRQIFAVLDTTHSRRLLCAAVPEAVAPECGGLLHGILFRPWRKKIPLFQ
jgi:hypothetical protein